MNEKGLIDDKTVIQKANKILQFMRHATKVRR